MEIEIQEARNEDKPVLRHLMELCQHDYSEYNDDDVNEHGLSSTAISTTTGPSRVDTRF